MQQIERYGVIALVFLLVTIVAVSFWSDGKSPGFWSRLSGRGAPKKEAALEEQVASSERALHEQPPLSPVPPAGDAPRTASTAPGPVETAPEGEKPIAGHSNDGGQTPPPLEPHPGETPPRGTATASKQDFPAETAPQPPSSPAQHVVRKGESLAAIAKSRLGDENRWREIAALNAGLDPKRLKVGQTIQLPTGAPTQAAKPDAPKPVQAKDAPKIASPKPAPRSAAPKSAASAREHVVARGETLRAIARSRLGDADRWREIVAVNPGLDPDRLRVGAKLRLPGGERAAPASPKPEKETAPVVAIQKPVVR